MKAWVLRHLQVMLGALGQLARAPLATLLTLVVLGITLALPASLYVAVDNLQRLGAGLEPGGQISLYLKPEVDEAAAQRLAKEIGGWPGIEHVRYISREAALAEFKRYSGFGATLEALDGNPLPAVLVVRPASANDTAAIETLRDRLAGLRGVDQAQLDLAWVQRLQALLRLAERAVWLLAALLAAAVLLITGNTIRLAVLSRQTEIEIIQLVGGTPAFIRRPFLYSGLFQGLLGGLLAWLLVEAGLMLLAGPVRDLATLYGSHFALIGLGTEAGLVLVALGGALGWAGSRLAVGWHLARLDRR